MALLTLVWMTAWVVQAQPAGDGARFTNGNNLVRPADFREWQFIGSSLGLTYEDGPPNQNPIFNNVYVNRSAYRAFMESGAWPNGTMFVLEFRRSSTGAEPNTTGRFQTELVGMEAEVKDSRFADGWGYYSYNFV